MDKEVYGRLGLLITDVVLISQAVELLKDVSNVDFDQIIEELEIVSDCFIDDIEDIKDEVTNG